MTRLNLLSLVLVLLSPLLASALAPFPLASRAFRLAPLSAQGTMTLDAGLDSNTRLRVPMTPELSVKLGDNINSLLKDFKSIKSDAAEVRASTSNADDNPLYVT